MFRLVIASEKVGVAANAETAAAAQDAGRIAQFGSAPAVDGVGGMRNKCRRYSRWRECSGSFFPGV